MADIIIPGVNKGKDDKETIQNLFDAYIRLRRELDFMLQNLDEENVIRAGSVYAENIDTRNAKIGVAQIENLVVGGNVVMGPDATISYNQVTDQPFIPNSPDDIGALTSQQLYTTLGQDYVVTGKIYANQLNGGVANLTDSVTIGTPNLDGDKSINFENMGNPVATIYKNRNGELSFWCDNKIRLSGYNGTQIAGAVGFFGTEPIIQQTATRLPDTATLADVIIKINGILGKLENYGLLDIIG